MLNPWFAFEWTGLLGGYIPAEGSVDVNVYVRREAGLCDVAGYCNTCNVTKDLAQTDMQIFALPFLTGAEAPLLIETVELELDVRPVNFAAYVEERPFHFDMILGREIPQFSISVTNESEREAINVAQINIGFNPQGGAPQFQIENMPQQNIQPGETIELILVPTVTAATTVGIRAETFGIAYGRSSVDSIGTGAHAGTWNFAELLRIRVLQYGFTVYVSEPNFVLYYREDINRHHRTVTIIPYPYVTIHYSQIESMTFANGLFEIVPGSVNQNGNEITFTIRPTEPSTRTIGEFNDTLTIHHEFGYSYHINLGLEIIRPTFNVVCAYTLAPVYELDITFQVGSDPADHLRTVAIVNTSQGILYINNFMEMVFSGNSEFTFNIANVAYLLPGESVPVTVSATLAASLIVGLNRAETLLFTHGSVTNGFGATDNVLFVLNVTEEPSPPPCHCPTCDCPNCYCPYCDGDVCGPTCKNPDCDCENCDGYECLCRDPHTPPCGDTNCTCHPTPTPSPSPQPPINIPTPPGAGTGDDSFTPQRRTAPSHDYYQPHEYYTYYEEEYEPCTEDANLLILPIDSDRIHRVTRRYTENGDIFRTLLEVEQDVYTWLDETESTMVSVRFVAYSLGLNITWDQETLTAVVDHEGRNLVFTYSQRHMYVNGTPIPLLNAHNEAIPTDLINNRLFVPLRPLGVALNMPINWNPHTRSAYLYITNGEPEIPYFPVEVLRIPVDHESVYMTQRCTVNGRPDLIHLFEVNGIPGWISSETSSPMIPLRFVAYALNLEIEWDAKTRTAIIDPHGHDIRFTHGQTLMRTNGYYLPIRSINGETIAATIQRDHMFVTPRSLGEALNLPVGWNPNTKTAYLYVVPPERNTQ
jgi:hypothetical protein